MLPGSPGTTTFYLWLDALFAWAAEKVCQWSWHRVLDRLNPGGRPEAVEPDMPDPDNFETEEKYRMAERVYVNRMRFRRDFYTGMYIHNLDDEGDSIELLTGEAMVVTVEDKLRQYSRREIRRAETARELQRKFYFLGDGSLEELLRRGKIVNTEVTAMDVARAKDIWGPSIGGLKGRVTVPHPYR